MNLSLISSVLIFTSLRPYHFWERGTNENTNGLIRQFLPKSISFDNLSDDVIQAIENNLNNRPRKVLGFNAP